MPTATANDQTLGYDDTGGGSGPAVVFSHGFFMDRTMFAPQLADLRDRFRCISVDARGFNESRSDGKPFTYWDSAADLIALLDHLGIERAAFVGLSQGGFTTMRVAIGHPERVTAVVLMDTDAEHYDEATQQAYRGGKDALLQHGWSDEYAASMAAILFGPGFDSSAWQRRWQMNPPAQIAESFETMITRDDIKPQLGSITCPALILHGELDGSIPLSAAEQVRDALGGPTELAVVPGSGHTSNLENPAFVNARLRTFLERHAR